MKPCTWSAAVASAPLGNLESTFNVLENAGCDELHFDVLDGRFASPIALGAGFVAMAKSCCALPCDAHLMVDRPDTHIQNFVDAGCDRITVHVEASVHGHRTLAMIREAGASPGIAINPSTPLTRLEYLLPLADRVLILANEPGDDVQPILRGAYERVKIVEENLRSRNLKTKIQIEGNYDAKSAAVFANTGADILVLGRSTIFDGKDFSETFSRFVSSVSEHRNII